MVRLIGLEPTRPKPPDPKSGASTNFATSAFAGAKIGLLQGRAKLCRDKLEDGVAAGDCAAGDCAAGGSLAARAGVMPWAGRGGRVLRSVSVC